MPHVRIIETLAANIVFLQPANCVEPYCVDDDRVRDSPACSGSDTSVERGFIRLIRCLDLVKVNSLLKWPQWSVL